MEASLATVASSSYLTAPTTVPTSLDHIWFHWPVALLLLIVVLWAVIRRKPP